jgi:cell wall-associated NlpC family hydrolase
MSLGHFRTLVIGLALAGMSGACASTGAVPKPFPTPGSAGSPGAQGARGPGSQSAPVRGARGAGDTYALVGTALSLRGAPYRNGGSDPKGFDCSGFTQYVFAQHGLSLPRDVKDQFRQGKSVNAQDIAPGDLVFFSTTDRSASHVAIAIGGDEFVHAPSSTGVVRVERLSSSYWSPRYLGAKRVSP